MLKRQDTKRGSSFLLAFREKVMILQYNMNKVLWVTCSYKLLS